MSFKLPSLPSSEAYIHELADFIELMSWNNGTASQREVLAYLGRLDDNEHNEGCDDDEDSNAELLDQVMEELSCRVSYCGPTGYPFVLEHSGTVLRHKVDDKTEKAIVYRYLLLSTRMNMKDDRLHNGIDGTTLLEEIAETILRNYVGNSRARSFVFGTASTTLKTFQSKVDELCKSVKEGGSYRNIDEDEVKAKDGKLDTVTWVPFSDGRSGQIIIFGQCKTGSNWESQITQLQPKDFIKKWIQDPFLVDPVRVFCLSESIHRKYWKSICIDGGIVLDRCRLVDFCHSLDAKVIKKLERWVNAAQKKIFTGAAFTHSKTSKPTPKIKARPKTKAKKGKSTSPRRTSKGT